MSLFLCLVGSLVDREFCVENHFYSEIRRLCSIVFSICYWDNQSHNSQPLGSFWDCLSFLLKFHSFVLSFFFFLIVNCWFHQLFLKLFNKVFQGKVLDFLFLVLISVIFLSWFWEISSINITFGWIFVCIFISTIIFLISKSSFLFFFIIPFQPCVSASFTVPD